VVIEAREISPPDVPKSVSEGTAFHLGLLTAILVGGTNVMQLFFAGMLMYRPRKQPFLIAGISLRVTALFMLGVFLITGSRASGNHVLLLRIAGILLIMAVFSFSGSFANISYMDILGKAIDPSRRKRFFVIKQTTASIGVILSALSVRLILGRFSYPYNYAYLFFIAAGLLFVASMGFWAIREPEASVKKVPDQGKKLSTFASVLREDKNLQKYLLMINTAGITLAWIPFLISLAGKSFGVSGARAGNFLLLQMTGALAANLFLNTFHKSPKYKGILYYFIIAGATLPLLALMLRNAPLIYPLLFLISGSTLTAYQITIPGILLEISTDENRAVYTGIAGAGSLAVLVYPVLAGFFITRFGYTPVFIGTSFLILSGLPWASRIVCKRFADPQVQPASDIPD
jgi:MFS family permease